MKKCLTLVLLVLLFLMWEHRSEPMYPVVRKGTNLCDEENEHQGIIPSER